MLAPLRIKGLRRLTISFLVSELGDGITTIVLPLAVYAQTSSGVLTGLAFGAVRLAGVFGTPVGGLMADRVDRLLLLRLSFVVRAGFLALGLLIGRVDVTLLMLLLTRVGGTIDNPAAEAAIREYAEQQTDRQGPGVPGQPSAADAAQAVATVRKVARATSLLVGPAVGGVLVSAFGVSTAIAVDLASFCIALVSLGTARSLVSRREASNRGGVVQVMRSTLVDAAAGIRHMRSHADLRLVAFSATVNSLLVGALLTSAVVYLAEMADAPQGSYGFALAAYAGGSLIGLVVAGMVRWRAPLSRVVWRGMVFYAVICVGGVAVIDWRILALSWFAWGIAYGPEEIISDVVLVTHTPSELMGRSYGAVGTLSSAGSAVGAIAGGVLGDVAGPRLVVAGLAAGYLVPAAGVWWWSHAAERSVRTRSRIRGTRDVDL